MISFKQMILNESKKKINGEMVKFEINDDEVTFEFLTYPDAEMGFGDSDETDEYSAFILDLKFTIKGEMMHLEDEEDLFYGFKYNKVAKDFEKQIKAKQSKQGKSK